MFLICTSVSVRKRKKTYIIPQLLLSSHADYETSYFWKVFSVLLKKTQHIISGFGRSFLPHFFKKVWSAAIVNTDHSHFSFLSNTILIFAEGVRNRQYITTTLCNGNYISTYPESLSEFNLQWHDPTSSLHTRLEWQLWLFPLWLWIAIYLGRSKPRVTCWRVQERSNSSNLIANLNFLIWMKYLQVMLRLWLRYTYSCTKQHHSDLFFLFKTNQYLQINS